jgi:hypothetical protein
MKRHFQFHNFGKLLLGCILALVVAVTMDVSSVGGQSPTPTPLRTDTGFYWPTGTDKLGSYARWLYDGCWPPYTYGKYTDNYYHIGWDIQANFGDPVYAIADGDIVWISSGPDSGWPYQTYYNNLTDRDVSSPQYLESKDNVGVLVKHRLSDGTEFIAVYGHVIATGNQGHLVAGQPFAKIGHYDGYSHLHFGIRKGTSTDGALGRLMCPATKPPNGIDDVSVPKNDFVNPIEWITKNRPGTYSIPIFSGTIVDNNSPNFARAGTPRFWNESSGGVNGNFLWTRNNKSKTDNTGTWKLPISQASTYDVFVFIPSEHSSTTKATYEIRHSGKMDHFSVNQLSNHNKWLNVGTFDFDAKGAEYIRLTDSTGETDQTTEIAFDAVGFMIHGQAPIEKFIDDILGRINQWIAAQQKGLEQWAREQTDRIMRELETLLARQLQQICTGGAIVFFMPALVFWVRERKQSNL